MRIGTRPLITHTLTPVLDTGAYADGDLLFIPTVLPDFWGIYTQSVLLQSVYVYDASANGAAFDLVFATADTSWGSINGAVSTDDAVTGLAVGHISVAAADYISLGAGAKAALPQFNPFVLSAADNAGGAGYVLGISRGTPTYAANSLKIRFGVVLG